MKRGSLRGIGTMKLAILMAHAMERVDLKKPETWSNERSEENEEKCLTLLTLPTGFTDGVKALFKDACERCDDKKECTNKDQAVSEFLDVVLDVGMRTLTLIITKEKIIP